MTGSSSRWLYSPIRQYHGAALTSVVGHDDGGFGGNGIVLIAQPDTDQLLRAGAVDDHPPTVVATVFVKVLDPRHDFTELVDAAVRHRRAPMRTWRIAWTSSPRCGGRG